MKQQQENAIRARIIKRWRSGAFFPRRRRPFPFTLPPAGRSAPGRRKEVQPIKPRVPWNSSTRSNSGESSEPPPSPAWVSRRYAGFPWRRTILTRTGTEIRSWTPPVITTARLSQVHNRSCHLRLLEGDTFSFSLLIMIIPSSLSILLVYCFSPMISPSAR